MSGSARYPRVAIGAMALALAIGAAWHPAHATAGTPPAAAAAGRTVDQAATDANRRAMAACKTLPSSERGICQQRAGYGQAVMHVSLSPAQRHAIDQENARYKRAMAACSHEPASRRTTCASLAGNDRVLAAGD